MPRYSVCIDFCLDALDANEARRRALDMSLTGVKVSEGAEGTTTAELQAGDGTVVNLDELERAAEYTRIE